MNDLFRPRLLLFLIIVFSSAQALAEKKILNYMFWGGEEEKKTRFKLVEEFNQANPDVAIKPIYAPDDYDRKLKTMMAAGIPPDIMMLSIDDVATWGPQGILLDLLPLIEADPDISLDQFIPQELERRTIAGKLYGINDAVETVMVFYNKRLFDKWSVPYPPSERIWTWAEFVETAKALTRDVDGDGKIDQWGTMVYQHPMLLSVLLWSLGSSFYSDDLTVFLPEPDRYLEAVRKINDLSTKHRVMQPYGDYRNLGQSVTYLMRTGKLAMLIWGNWYLIDMAAAGFEYDVAPFPVVDRPANILISTCYSINRSTKYPLEAWRAYKFLIGERGQVLLARTGLTLPNSKRLLFDPEARKSWLNERVHPEHYIEAAIAPIRYAGVEYSYPGAQQFYFEVLREHFNALGYANPEDLDDAVSEMATRGRKLFGEIRSQEAVVSRYPKIDDLLVTAGQKLSRHRYDLLIVVLSMLGFLFLGAIVASASKRVKRSVSRTLTGYLFVTPLIVGMVLWVFGPVLYTFLISLTSWDLVSSPRFVGLSNYTQLVSTDPLIKPALFATFSYAAISVPLGIIAALFVAMLLNTKVRGMPAFRTIFFLPSIVPPVVSAVLWLWIFNPEFGLINSLLRFIGVPDEIVKNLTWLKSEDLVMPSLWLMSLWGIGGAMVIFLAGLQQIPDHLYEAAELDGAGFWSKFRHITLPMISPIVFFNLIMGIIASFQVFVAGYLMTEGGPNNATLFYVLYLYQNAFHYLKMGYASAMAWVLFLVILLVTIATYRYFTKKVYYEDG